MDVFLAILPAGGKCSQTLAKCSVRKGITDISYQNGISLSLYCHNHNEYIAY